MFDHSTPDFLNKTHEVFSYMRENHGVFRHGTTRWPFVSVFNYETIRRVLQDQDTFSSEMPDVNRLLLQDAGALIEVDPPVHTKLRTLLSPTFHQKFLDYVNANVEEITKKSVECSLNKHIDFIEDVAAPIALAVICKILGWPEEDQNFLRDWTNRFSAAVGSELVETEDLLLNKQELAVTILQKELTDKIQDLISNPTSNQSSGLIYESAEWGMAIEQRIGILKSFAFAGNHSSAILLGNAIYLLGKYPEQYELLLKPETNINNVCSEILRYKGTFRGIMRRCTKETTLCGVPLFPEDYVLLWLASGNRDKSVFDSPDEFSIERQFSVPHLSFGFGRHYCIGASMALMELRALLSYFRANRIRFNLDGKEDSILDPWVDGFSRLPIHLFKENL